MAPAFARLISFLVSILNVFRKQTINVHNRKQDQSSQAPKSEKMQPKLDQITWISPARPKVQRADCSKSLVYRAPGSKNRINFVSKNMIAVRKVIPGPICRSDIRSTFVKHSKASVFELAKLVLLCGFSFEATNSWRDHAIVAGFSRSILLSLHATSWKKKLQF